jgi:hypothetical protein
MRISRRNFLSITGTVATLFPFRHIELNAFNSEPKVDADCALLDLGTNCCLRESLWGYRAALANKFQQLSPTELTSLSQCRVVIVPGVGMMDAALSSLLSGLLQSGSTLLLESGAGFLSHREFALHQRMLQQYFDITIERPVDLWWRAEYDALRKLRLARHSRNECSNGQAVPYVHYQWPSEVKVRDFSRAIPVSAPSGNAVGRIGDLQVAWKMRVGRGMLIFLGSPMGPALRAGDSDARAWLHSATEL